MMDANLYLRLGLIFASCMLLTSCLWDQATPDPDSTIQVEETPVLPASTSPVAEQGEFLFYDLDCTKITDVRPGPSWNGLVIGESTLDDVKAVLGEEGILQQNGSLFFSNRDRDLYRDDWHLADTCYVNNKLSALKLDATLDLPRHLDDWINMYGQPITVTWGIDLTNRTLIWSEAGVLAVIDVIMEYQVKVLFFSPFPAVQLDESWLLQSLPKVPRPYESDDAIPISYEEDPWHLTN